MRLLDGRLYLIIILERQQQQDAGGCGSDGYGVEPAADGLPGLDTPHNPLLHVVGHLQPCGTVVLSLQGLAEKLFIIHRSFVLG
jgi:hypothetical protein